MSTEYEFIPIVYPNKEPDTSVPSPLPQSYDVVTADVVAGRGLPFIASAPYVAPEPVPAPLPLPTIGVIVNPADTLMYRPLTELPATTTISATTPYSLPSFITSMGGNESLYAPYTSGTESAKDWSLYPAVSTVTMSGYGMTGTGSIDFAPSTLMTNVGSMTFAPGATITGVQEISISDGGFGSLTLNSDGIENAGVVTGIDSLQLNTQILTALPDALLLNGVPIATISNLPNIYQWANYPALSTIVMNAPGTGLPKSVQGCYRYGFHVGTSVQSFENVSSGTYRLIFTPPSGNEILGGTIWSQDLTGSESATGQYTGVNKWANFPAIQNVDFGGKEITNINKITFNTAVPGLGGASINALNDLNFSYATALAGQAGLTNVNNIAFWNPNAPGVPGFYANMYSKSLTYANQPASVFLATDTKLAVPALYLNGALGQAGGKIEIQGPNAQTALINGNPCAGAWSQYPCTEPALNMNGHIIVSCRQIDFTNGGVNPVFNLLSIDNQGYLTYTYNQVQTRITPAANWSTEQATQDVDMAGFGLINLDRAVFTGDPNNVLLANGTTLEWRGQPVQTGAAPDNVANWANYTAVNTVNIPHQYALNINGENYTPPFHPYQTSKLNTNIQHGDPGNEFECPDFDSYPVNFTVHNSRSVSLNSTSAIPLVSGIGLNAIAEVNIEGGVFVGINTAVLETNGAATTFNAETTMLLTSPEISVTGGAVTVNGAATVQVGGGTCEVTGLTLLALTTVGELNIAGGVTTMETADFTATTGVSLWSAPSMTFAGGNVNIAGILTTMTAATLSINNSSGTAINSPVTTINSVRTTIAAGRTLEVDNIVPTTANSLDISGVNIIAGRTDTGMIQTEVKSIAGNGSGMDITNIANFETYSATNVLLPCKTLQAAIPSTALNTTSYQLVYGSGTKIWSWLNIPSLVFSYSVFGNLTNSGTHASGDSAPIGMFIQLKNTTTPANSITLAVTIAPGIYAANYTTSTATGGTQSSFVIANNYTVVNDGSQIKQGDSYEVTLWMRNAQASPASNAVTLDTCTLSLNVHNAGNL